MSRILDGGAQQRGKPARDTRGAILREAIGLLSENGFAALSTREIAKRVGIASPSIYKHFASVDEIVTEALVAITMARIDDYAPALALDVPPAEKLKAIAIAAMDAFLRDETIVSLYKQITMPRNLATLRFTSALWDRGLYPTFIEVVREVDREADPVFAYYVLFSFCLGAASFMPLQDARAPLPGSQRNAVVLAERGLIAALPRIDWSSVAPASALA